MDTDLGPNGASSTLMNIGDEPDFLIPYLYNFINKNYQTVSHVQMLIDQYFSAGLDGIPGMFLVLVLDLYLLRNLLVLHIVMPSIS